jgi:hypothetical protein
MFLQNQYVVDQYSVERSCRFKINTDAGGWIGGGGERTEISCT